MQIWKLCASLSVKLNVWIVWMHVGKIYYASPNAFGITNHVSMVSQLWPRFEPLVPIASTPFQIVRVVWIVPMDAKIAPSIFATRQQHPR